MAFVAVTSLMRTMELELSQPNPRLALQNKELIVSVHTRLRQLLDFLDDSEKKPNTSEEMRDLIPRIRDVTLNFLAEVTLEAEDDIEAAVLAEALHEAEMLGGDSVHNTLDETLQRVLQYTEEVREIIKVADNLVKNNFHVREDGPSSRVSSVLQENISNGCSSHHSSKPDGAMVGHSEELKDVMDKIFQSSLKRRQVMAMVGMGGIGKTTFARTIYDDPRTSSHFNLRGWTTVSQGYSVVRVLLELCRSIISMHHHTGIEGVDLIGCTTVPKEQNAMYVLHELCDSIMSNLDDRNIKGVDDLKQQLRKVLLGQRYLIIVDDIWSKNAWDDIKRCFPDENENNGSRILLTTRQKEVAEYADSGEYSFAMRLLKPEESWTLFYQKLRNKESLDMNFKEVGKKIVNKCHGLPLAIVLLAGLLSTGNKSLDEWKNLETTTNSLGALDLGEQFYSRIFNLSYTSLPHYLKGCFLYFGLFPEDSEISIKKIIRLWIAEGLVIPHSKKRIEEVGKDYLHDLIKRSLVMVSGKSFDGEIKTCKMHDVLHNMCENKAEEENLLYIHREKDDDCVQYYYYPQSIELDENRWISLRVTSPFFCLRLDLSNSRSILYFNMFNWCDRDWSLGVDFFKKLRVLDLSKICFFRSMPEDIIELVFLRYLALASNQLLFAIPLRRNRNLQTLVIREDDNGVQELPDGIWDLPQLRHLEFYHQVSIYPPKVVQENLQTIYWLYAFQCTKEVFLRIPNVKELGIIARGRRCRHFDNLGLLDYLQKLTIQGSYLPIHLHHFPRNLKKLIFVKTFMPWKEMTVVSLLPNLETLKLKRYGCVGEDWELTQENGFPRLKFLLISISDLRNWNADIDNPFPVLERLLLRNCFELKEMPNWIGDICTLQLMHLDHCRQSLVNSARQIQTEKQSLGGTLVIQEFNTQSDIFGNEEDEKNKGS